MKKISALVIIRDVLAGVLMLAATRAWLRHGVVVEFSADSKSPAPIRIEGVVKESPETKGSTVKASVRIFEFACGLLFYRYIRPDFKRYTCCAAFGALLVAVYLTVSPKNMFLFSFGNIILQLALALCILYVLDLIKYEGCVMEVFTFLSSLSFLVFLYHKRVIYLFADCFGKKVMTNEVFIHFVLLALLGCYILAYLSVKPVAVVRKLFSKCISGDNAK